MTRILSTATQPLARVDQATPPTEKGYIRYNLIYQEWPKEYLKYPVRQAYPQESLAMSR